MLNTNFLDKKFHWKNHFAVEWPFVEVICIWSGKRALELNDIRLARLTISSLLHFSRRVTSTLLRPLCLEKNVRLSYITVVLLLFKPCFGCFGSRLYSCLHFWWKLSCLVIKMQISNTSRVRTLILFCSSIAYL